jgi:hypothetical protein
MLNFEFLMLTERVRSTLKITVQHSLRRPTDITTHT